MKSGRGKGYKWQFKSQALLILQPFHHFTYITTHFLTLPSLYLCHSSFSNPSVASPTVRHSSFSNPSFASPKSQALLILQPFRHFTYVTTHSPTLPSLHLRHSSLSNPSFASPTSQALHLLLLASRPCFRVIYWKHPISHSRKPRYWKTGCVLLVNRCFIKVAR